MILTIAAVGHSLPAGRGDNTIHRTGRNIQVDGFLLEWKRADARPWMETGWEWDAIITANGISGYIRAGAAPACSAWTFDIIPKEDILAADYANQTTEWLIYDTGINKITINAYSACGDTLPALTLPVSHTPPAASPILLYAVIIMAFAAVLTVVIVIKRRRRKTA